MVSTFSTFDPKKCVLCNSKKYRVLLNINNRVLRTNNSIVKSNLKKIECLNCGLVRNGTIWNKHTLKNYYGKNYRDHFKVNENSMFVTEIGTKDRSTVIADWIEKIFKKIDNPKIKTVIEVGCGTGSLLQILKQKFPKKKFVGLENSLDAIKIGKKRELDIRSTKNVNVKGDLIISYAVIEHTSNPVEFIKFLSTISNSDGLILIGQPQQDKLSSDIFYEDHLFHFAAHHIKEIGRKANLVQLRQFFGKKTLENFSFHLLKKSKKNISNINPVYHKTNVQKSIKHYQKIFKEVNKILKHLNSETKIGVFGTNLFFHLFYTYTNLGRSKISLAIDDYPSGKKFNFPVVKSSSLNSEKIDVILLCINPIYIKFIINKLGKNKFKFLNPFEKP